MVAGCGSSGGRVSKSQYERHLRTDGQAITKAFEPLTSAPGSLDQLASELKTGVSKLRDASSDLDGLKPPKDAEKDNAALVSGLRELADELESLRKAAEKRDPSLVAKTLNRLRHSHGLLNARRATDDLRKKGYSLGVSQ